MSLIKTDELDQFHSADVYKSARIICLFGEIDEATTNTFIKNIRLLDHISDKDITVLMNTIGGDVHLGLAIYDAIRECQSNVIIHCVANCWSAGAIILQAGDVRKISKNATVMLHVGNSDISDHSENFKRWAKEHERLGQVFEDILYEKMREKKSDFRKSQLKKMLMFDTILVADQAVVLGLVDEVVEHKYINK